MREIKQNRTNIGKWDNKKIRKTLKTIKQKEKHLRIVTISLICTLQTIAHIHGQPPTGMLNTMAAGSDPYRKEVRGQHSY